LASLIIRSLRTSAEQFLGRRVSEVMASAPANFTIRQWNSLLKACQMAGLTVKRLVGEPSAAAVIVAGEHLPGRNSYDAFFVLDLGGGTFDVSVIEAGEGVWEIKAAGGDRNLGGVDYDEALSRYIGSVAQSKLAKLGHELTEIDRVQIRREAERAKISLTTREETSVILPNLEVPGKGIANLEIPISRSMFRALTEELNFRLERCILDVLRRSWVRKKEINSVWSTGQGAKIFTVSEIIGRLFPGIPLVTEFQENAVALGLGRYTGVLSGVTKDVLLLDATATAIGLKCSRQRDQDEDSPIEFWISPDHTQNTQTHILLPRDTTIPTLSSSAGRVVGDRTEPITLEFVEVDLNGDEIALGTVPTAPSALDFEINFDVDANRTIILKISSNGQILEALQINNFSDTLRFSIESFWDIRGKRPMKLLAAKNLS
jgi:molecular chaperone DnaK (HSP70)